MPKISLNIDDDLMVWIASKQKETKASRTDVILAVLKACRASETKANDQPPPAPAPTAAAATTRIPTTSQPSSFDVLQFTLDTFFQRYLSDHPNDDETPLDRWRKVVKARNLIMSSQISESSE